MVKGRRWVLKQHFVGEPKPEDFELVEEELPALKENEIQYRSLFLSVDPYMRPYTMRMSPPFTMIGSSVAVVEETRQLSTKLFTSSSGEREQITCLFWIPERENTV